MFNFFKKRKQPAIPAIPAIGDIWHIDNDNPFDITEVYILDIKEGYVQYRFANTVTKHSLSVYAFIYLYTKKATKR